MKADTRHVCGCVSVGVRIRWPYGKEWQERRPAAFGWETALPISGRFAGQIFHMQATGLRPIA